MVLLAVLAEIWVAAPPLLPSAESGAGWRGNPTGNVETWHHARMTYTTIKALIVDMCVCMCVCTL